LPETARRVLVVGGSSSDDVGILAALEVAEIVARHRPRTIFVNTVAGAAGPDQALGAEGRPGLFDVTAGRSRVADVAFRPAGRSFIAIPAGESIPGILDLSDIAAFRHLVEAAGRGGMLLLYLSETGLGQLCRAPSHLEALAVDGLVLLGGTAVPRHIPGGLRVLARIESETPPEAAPRLPAGWVEAEGRRSGTKGGGFYRPSGTPPIVMGEKERRVSGESRAVWLHRLRRNLPSRGLGGVAVVWLVAVLAVWLVWQGLSGWPAFEEEIDPVVESDAPAREAAEASAEPTGAREAAPPAEPVSNAEGGEGGADRPDSVPAIPPSPAGVDLPYSVLVASLYPFEEAERKRSELEESGILAFVAPTPVGDRLYYRVFAGALEDRLQARELMRRLVESREKERERDWDMRPARLAFDLGEFADPDEAESERRRLHESGVPAYVLAAGDSTGAIYRLYSGAYESEEAAGPADSLLSAAGVTATLVTRRGEPQ
jgi:cell division septation protein DedD